MPPQETESPEHFSPITNTVLDYGPTLGDMIENYQTDPLSTFHKLRYHVRMNAANLHRRLRTQYGRVPLSAITGRTLIEWHTNWCRGDKFSIGHAFIAQLRTIAGFGFALLGEPECRRISEILGKLRFPQSGAREERITAEQAETVRTWAHVIGWHSIALAQAIQFELMLRQKDVIGEWLPSSEGIASSIAWQDQTWHRGLRWSEVDDNLILRHVTSKRQKPIIADLTLAPMVMEELEFLEEIPSDDEPIIICETSGMPYTGAEYRRKWRIVAKYAGVPLNVFNMDSRSGAISEAFEAGVTGERIQKTATHSDIGMTQRYNRGDYLRASSEVQAGRIANRHVADGDTRDAKWHRINTSDVPRSPAKKKA